MIKIFEPWFEVPVGATIPMGTSYLYYSRTEGVAGAKVAGGDLLEIYDGTTRFTETLLVSPLENASLVTWAEDAVCPQVAMRQGPFWFKDGNRYSRRQFADLMGQLISDARFIYLPEEGAR